MIFQDAIGCRASGVNAEVVSIGIANERVAERVELDRD